MSHNCEQPYSQLRDVRHAVTSHFAWETRNGLLDDNFKLFARIKIFPTIYWVQDASWTPDASLSVSRPCSLPLKPISSPKKTSSSGPHPHSLDCFTSAEEAGLHIQLQPSTNGLHAVGHANLPPQLPSLSHHKLSQKCQRRTFKNRIPVGSPIRRLSWKPHPYPLNKKAALSSKLESQSRRSEAGARTQVLRSGPKSS